jgi:hypothetical protein
MTQRRPAPPTAPVEVAAEDQAPAESSVGGVLEGIAEASVPRAAQPPAAVAVGPLPVLALARATRRVADELEVELGGRVLCAAIDVSVHPLVIDGACARGESLLATVEGDRVTVVGALRTQPTPGVDAMDEITLEARRVNLVGGDEVQIRSGVAVIALRAVGEVETYADRIISRAEELQKIVARMLRLN